MFTSKTRQYRRGSARENVFRVFAVIAASSTDNYRHDAVELHKVFQQAFKMGVSLSTKRTSCNYYMILFILRLGRYL